MVSNCGWACEIGHWCSFRLPLDTCAIVVLLAADLGDEEAGTRDRVVVEERGPDNGPSAAQSCSV